MPANYPFSGWVNEAPFSGSRTTNSAPCEPRFSAQEKIDEVHVVFPFADRLKP
jgi:hypothetical protein